jgi:AcrR family transcriptional regulator
MTTPIHPRGSEKHMKRSKADAKADASDESNLQRRDQILAEAAKLFYKRGYAATSVRDIANATGLLPGSLYYYVKSKEELFLEVHKLGMKALLDAAREACSGIDDPWEKLEAIAVAHSRVLLEDKGLMIMVAPLFSAEFASLKDEIIRQRTEYEGVIDNVIAGLNLAEGTNRRLFRLQFLGALNWAQTWYRADGAMSAAEIGAHLVLLLRPPASTPAGRVPA